MADLIWGFDDLGPQLGAPVPPVAEQQFFSDDEWVDESQSANPSLESQSTSGSTANPYLDPQFLNAQPGESDDDSSPPLAVDAPGVKRKRGWNGGREKGSRNEE